MVAWGAKSVPYVVLPLTRNILIIRILNLSIAQIAWLPNFHCYTCKEFECCHSSFPDNACPMTVCIVFIRCKCLMRAQGSSKNVQIGTNDVSWLTKTIGRWWHSDCSAETYWRRPVVIHWGWLGTTRRRCVNWVTRFSVKENSVSAFALFLFCANKWYVCFWQVALTTQRWSTKWRLDIASCTSNSITALDLVGKSIPSVTPARTQVRHTTVVWNMKDSPLCCPAISSMRCNIWVC